MAFVSRTFDNSQELMDYLNDIPLSVLLEQRVYGLDGLALIINDGTADRTTTFSDASGLGLTARNILEQIRATHASMANVGLRNYGHVSPPRSRLGVFLAPYVIKKTGTANPTFGFSATADTTVGANAVAAADIVTLSPVEGNRYWVVHE